MVNFFNRKGDFYLQLGIVLAVTFLASNFVGLSRGGFDSAEILNLQNFYLIGIAFALIIFSAFKYEGSSDIGDKKYGSSVGFASLGEKPHMKFFRRFTAPQIFFIFFILFSILFLINVFLAQQGIGQKTYTGVGFLTAQQFTPVDSLIYSTALVPGSENLGAAAFVSLLIVFLGIFVRKRKISETNYKLFLILLIVFGLLFFGLGNHLLRYRDSEVALRSVAVFWGVGGLLTAITGSFLPFWAMHITNNLFFDLSRLFSSEAVLFWTIAFIILLIGIYAVIYRGRFFGVKGGAKEKKV